MKTSRIFISALLTEAVGVLVILAVWGGVSSFYPSYIIPSPVETLSGIASVLPVDLTAHLLITLYRILIGFVIAFIFGTAGGILAALARADKPMNSLMVALQVVPGTILGVIFLLMFGIGSATPIALVAFLTLPTLAINTTNGLSKRSIANENYLRSIHASKWQIVRYSYLPALIPVLQSNLSLGISMAVKVVVLGEFIGSQNGLGYLLNHARIVFNMKEVFFYLLLLMAFSLIFQALQSLFFTISLKKYAFPEAL
jgi:NitT/TauT family transport system permease protein